MQVLCLYVNYTIILYLTFEFSDLFDREIQELKGPALTAVLWKWNAQVPVLHIWNLLEFVWNMLLQPSFFAQSDLGRAGSLSSLLRSLLVKHILFLTETERSGRGCVDLVSVWSSSTLSTSVLRLKFDFKSLYLELLLYWVLMKMCTSLTRSLLMKYFEL